MLNNKLGVSKPWNIRSMRRFNISNLFLTSLLKDTYKKNDIYISNVYIHEYPSLLQFIFVIHPLNESSYNNINLINELIKALSTIIFKKNINISFKLSDNIMQNVEILSEWTHDKLYLQPLNIKRLLKSLKRYYVTTSNKSKHSR